MNLLFDMYSCTPESFPVYLHRLATPPVTQDQFTSRNYGCCIHLEAPVIQLILEYVFGTMTIDLCDPLQRSKNVDVMNPVLSELSDENN